MRIKTLYVSNFLGAASVDLQLAAPVQLFAGRNGAGKSSLRDAIALALTADLGRVSLKKDAPQLIHAGADGACCEISTDDGDTYSVTISAAGKIADSQKGREPDPTLNYVLDAQRFARLDATERRAFLYGLMGVKIGQADIAKRLKTKGADEAKVQRVLPLMRSGFDAAAKQAKANATEAKGAWRAVTGETFGSAKAVSWRAPVPHYDAAAAKEANTELQHCDVAVEQWQRQVGKLLAEEQRRAGLRAKVPALREHAAKLERIRNKLTADEAGLAEWEQRLAATNAEAGQGKRVGLVHDLAKGLAWCLSFENPHAAKEPEELEAIEAVAAYEREFGKIGAAGSPEAQAKLPEVKRSRDLMASAVTNGKRDLADAELAKSTADDIEAELAGEFDEAGLAAARAQVETLKAAHADLVKKADAFKTIKAQADAADKKTAEAEKHAADVAAWDVIGDALSPDGIPAEILAEALGPINDRLAQTAEDTGWAPITIAPDMAITATGREYRLLSESEQWRADAVLAEAIAHLSGMKLLVLDRFDVLDAEGRQALLGWLHTLAELGEVDTVFLFGTLKAAPTGLPSTIATYWIENGVVAQLKEAA